MKKFILMALTAIVLSVFVQGYLTLHYYPLQYGLGSAQSLCNVSATFDCNAVSASRFSAVFGIPLAAYGTAFNLILALLVILNWFGFRGSNPKIWRQTLFLALISLITSMVMALISATQLENWCLFCIFAYILSLIQFVALYLANEPGALNQLKDDALDWLSEDRGFLYWLTSIPALSVLIHLAMVQNYGADQLEKVVSAKLQDWKSRPVIKWQTPPALKKGLALGQPKMTIVEFADFRCGHCKHAAPSLSAFVKAHSDVELHFYPFPLDSSCNKAIQHGDGVSCLLAKLTLCSEKQGQGWKVHDLIFDHQNTFHTLSLSESQSTFDKLSSHLELNREELKTCVNSIETHQLIERQAEEGANAKIKGTPTVFVNGKLLENGQLIPVLKGVYNSL